VTANSLNDALQAIPDLFRDHLISEYIESQKAALVGDWEKVGLKAGKICEIALCILEGFCTETYPSQIEKPRNMQDACKQLEQKSKPGTARSAKIQMPRIIAAIYELRNNRAIGHASGEVSPNEMDGLLFNRSIKWLMAEFIRLFSGLPLLEAAKLVEQISFRWNMAIWENEGRKRVLIKGLGLKDQVLVLLYFSDMKSTLNELRSWLEIGNITHFRIRQIKPLHDEHFIDFDIKSGRIHLLPSGADRVETAILPLVIQ